jgi:hypothetical protein
MSKIDKQPKKEKHPQEPKYKMMLGTHFPEDYEHRNVVLALIDSCIPKSKKLRVVYYLAHLLMTPWALWLIGEVGSLLPQSDFFIELYLTLASIGIVVIIIILIPMMIWIVKVARVRRLGIWSILNKEKIAPDK